MKDQKRAKNVAIAAAVLQSVITVTVIILWRVTGSQAGLSSVWMLLGGVGLWLVTALLFYARQLERQESAELDELAQRGGGEDGIFEESDKLELRPANRRLLFMFRWLVPVFTLVFAAYHAATGGLMLRYLKIAAPAGLTNTPQATVFLLIVGFGGFLFSRYCTGMSDRAPWRLLRSGGSYLLMCMVFIAALVVDMLFASQGNNTLDKPIAFVLPIIQLFFAAELLLNFVLDIYRPRTPGDEYRPCYDSRLFNLLAEPSRVGHSIADTINYQFGFEVSGTWFYQLLSRAIVPLIVFAVGIMFAISSIVVVSDGEQYVVKHWGKVPPDHRTLGAGVHLKWPWPIDTAERFDTALIQELIVGLGEERTATLTKDGTELILWTEEHGFGAREERDFLIGVPPRSRSHGKADEGPETGKAPSVSIIKLVVAIQYRITDAYKYGYKYTDAHELLRCLAGKEMVQYCASATLDEVVSDRTDRPQAIMTLGRSAAAEALKRRIQKRAGQGGLDLGVEIVYVGIISAHPPSQAVPQFEKVLEAERLQDQQRYEAEAKANRTLAEVAGDPGDALNLSLELQKAEVFEELARLKDTPRFGPAIDEYTSRAEGQIKALGLEIYREKLLGKKPSDLKSHIELKNAYDKFLAQLRLAKGNDFDYAVAIREAAQDVRNRFSQLEGEPARLIAEAQAYRWRRELEEKTALHAYSRQLLPYLAAPRVYRFDRYMEVLDESLPGMLKYVVGVDRDRLEIRVNLEKQKRDLVDVATERTDEDGNE